MDKSCPTCKKYFTYASRLKTHLETTIHCKKTPEEIESFFLQFKKQADFKCDICNKDFTKKQNLQRHINNSNCKIEYEKKEREKQIAILQKQIDELKKPIQNTQQPISNQPISTQPISTHPISTQPISIQPISTQPISTNSTSTQPINGEPASTQLTATQIQIINNNHNERIINNNLIINNTIVQHIYPLGYEKLPNISQDEMMRLLELGNEGVIEIVKLVCEQDENKNFYKLNMNKKNISFLSNQYKIDICQETELKKTLLKQCIILTYQMLIACSPLLSSEKMCSINTNLQNMSDKMKMEIYDNGLKNIIEYELRNNNKITKDKIIKYTKEINENIDIKEQALINYNNALQLKDKSNKLLLPCITLCEINSELGNPLNLHEMSVEFTYRDFDTKRFEDTTYLKYWNKRIIDEDRYIKSHPNVSLCDIANFEKRKIEIIINIEFMKNQSDNMRQYNNNNRLVNNTNFILRIPIDYIKENENSHPNSYNPSIHPSIPIST